MKLKQQNHEGYLSWALGKVVQFQVLEWKSRLPWELTTIKSFEGPKEGVKRDVKAASRDKKEAKEDVIAAENVKLAKSAQTNKKRKRLLERIETSERRKKGEKDKLVAKRAKIDQKKAEEKKAAKKANKKK